jgi:hypothetical protein
MNLVYRDSKLVLDPLHLWLASEYDNGRRHSVRTYNKILTETLELAAHPVVLIIGLAAEFTPLDLQRIQCLSQNLQGAYLCWIWILQGIVRSAMSIRNPTRIRMLGEDSP